MTTSNLRAFPFPTTGSDTIKSTQTSKAARVSIWTDGACSGNGQSNPQGGWGAVLLAPSTGRRLKLAGKLKGSPITNNRAELSAVIEALLALKKPSSVDLTTDSEYVKNGADKWRHGWKKKGWKNSSGKPVKNADLWKELDRLLYIHSVRFHWVRGHSGHPENELADYLAVAGAEGDSVREYDTIESGSV